MKNVSIYVGLDVHKESTDIVLKVIKLQLFATLEQLAVVLPIWIKWLRRSKGSP